MIQNSADICKISNTYLLKSLFAYLDYQYILKLLKNNKNLQNKLGINIENYKKESNCQNYQYEKTKDLYYFYDDYQYNNNCCIYYLKSILLFIYFGYIFMYILLCSSKGFRHYLDIKYYNDYLKLQIVININEHLWIICLLLIILTCIIFFIYSNKICLYEKPRAILIIITQFFQFFSEAIIILRMALSYKIREEKIIKNNWILEDIYFLIILDYIFISSHFIFSLYTSFRFCKNVKKYIMTTSNEYILKSLNNIKIKSYIISNDFIKMSKKKQLQYILNNCKYFEYFLTEEQKDLIKLINEYRKNNNLKNLLFDKHNKVPNFIIKKPAEIILNPTQHFFQLSNKEYLYRYPIGEFKIKLQNIESNIIRTLSNKDINYIKIIGQEEYEYIYLCELLYNEIFDLDETKRDNNNKIENDYDYKLFVEDND